MKWRIVLPSILILLLAVALGAHRLAAGGLAAEIVLADDDNGQRAEIEKRQVLVVTLESNPSTGYRWEAVELEGNILQQAGEAEFQPQSDAVGVSGVETLWFRAMGAGETTLRLVYHRPWEKGVKPLSIFSCEVVVR